MSGQLSMQKADLGWSRRPKKKVVQPLLDLGEEEHVDDDSDVVQSDDDDEPETEEKAPPLPFYTSNNPQPAPPLEKLPDKDELMLLRFIKPSDDTHGRIAQTKRKAVEDDKAPVRMKKKPVLGGVGIGDLFGQSMKGVRPTGMSGVRSQQTPKKLLPEGIASKPKLSGISYLKRSWG